MKKKFNFALSGILYVVCSLMVLGVIGLTMEGPVMLVFMGIIVPLYVAATIVSIVNQRRGF